jgi:hypothetical protein
MNGRLAFKLPPDPANKAISEPPAKHYKHQARDPAKHQCQDGPGRGETSLGGPIFRTTSFWNGTVLATQSISTPIW